MRILIPIEENKGEESKLAWHFGRAPFFAIFDTERNELKIIENKSEFFGGMGKTAEVVLKYKPDVVFVKGIGPRAIDLLKSQGIKIVTGNYSSVKEVLTNREKLKELEKACKD